MALNTDLSWKATVSDDWITVNPSEGIGSQEVNVIIEPSKTIDDDSDGVITFTCLDCGITTTKKVTVKRKKCKEAYRNIYYTGSSVTVEACESSKTFSIPYTETIMYTENCKPSTKSGIVEYTCNFYKNNTQNPKTYVFYYPENRPNGYATLTINQKAGPCQCHENQCTCYVVDNATGSTTVASKTSTDVRWNYSAITWTTDANCNVESGITETGISSTTVSFMAATCENNTKSGEILWIGHKKCDYVNKTCSNDDVIINWKVNQAKPSNCDCTCDDLRVEGKTIEFDSGVGIAIGTYNNNTCVTNLTISTETTWVSNIRLNNGVVTANVEENRGLSQRNATITVSGDANETSCTKQFVVYQNPQSGDPCQGKTIDIQPKNKTLEYTGGTISFSATT